MDDDDYIECTGKCRFVVRREPITAPDGQPAIEEIELCTGCGMIVSREIVMAKTGGKAPRPSA
jgi:MinD superfamily P-loop ATPase